MVQNLSTTDRRELFSLVLLLLQEKAKLRKQNSTDLRYPYGYEPSGSWKETLRSCGLYAVEQLLDTAESCLDSLRTELLPARFANVTLGHLVLLRSCLEAVAQAHWLTEEKDDSRLPRMAGFELKRLREMRKRLSKGDTDVDGTKKYLEDEIAWLKAGLDAEGVRPEAPKMTAIIAKMEEKYANKLYEYPNAVNHYRVLSGVAHGYGILDTSINGGDVPASPQALCFTALSLVSLAYLGLLEPPLETVA